MTNVWASAMGKVGDGDPADRAGSDPLLLEDVIRFGEGEVWVPIVRFMTTLALIGTLAFEL